MSDYTPTTEWVIAGWMKARASDGVTADVAVEEINRWFAEVIRKAKADAWEECAQEAYDRGMLHDITFEDIQTLNPYRQGETE